MGYAPTALAVSSLEKNWEVWGRRRARLKVAIEEPLVETYGLDEDTDDDQRTKKPKADEDKLLGHAWPTVIQRHIDHWANRPDAREYANDDIVYTRALDHHFGDPTPGDDDSILACMVPVVRWHGFRDQQARHEGAARQAQATVTNAPVNINKPGEVRAYITAAMDEMEGLILEDQHQENEH